METDEVSVEYLDVIGVQLTELWNEARILRHRLESLQDNPEYATMQRCLRVDLRQKTFLLRGKISEMERDIQCFIPWSTDELQVPIIIFM